MRLLRTIFAVWAFVFLACGLPSAPARAGSFASVAPEAVAELEAMHQQAIDSLLKNDFEGAIRAYSDILLMEPDDETAYTGLGQIYLVLGRYQKANDAFTNALEINPDNQVALVGIQTILDPDGVEGLVSRQQAELEPSPVVTNVSAGRSIAPIAASFAPRAKMDARRSAGRVARRQEAPAGRWVRPAARPPAPPHAASDRAALVRRLPIGLRPGHLHAQRIQMALRNAGFYNGPVNGLIGLRVKTSIRDFQKSFGLRPDGKSSGATWAKLSEYLSAR